MIIERPNNDEKRPDEGKSVQERVVMRLLRTNINIGNFYLAFCFLTALSVPIFSHESIGPFFQILLMLSFILCGISGKKTFYK